MAGRGREPAAHTTTRQSLADAVYPVEPAAQDAERWSGSALVGPGGKLAGRAAPDPASWRRHVAPERCTTHHRFTLPERVEWHLPREAEEVREAMSGRCTTGRTAAGAWRRRRLHHPDMQPLRPRGRAQRPPWPRTGTPRKGATAAPAHRFFCFERRKPKRPLFCTSLR